MPFNQQTVNYDELAALFSGKPEEFVKVLKMVHEDFLNNHILIMDAIADKDLDLFKRTYHNLRGNINLFDLFPLRDLMNKIERNLEEGYVKDSTLVEELHNKFNLISQSLENKIKELS